MDTDWCIQKLVRTDQEGSECAQRKIEETAQYWAAQEKKAAMNYRCALELKTQYPIKEYNNCTLKINHKKWLIKLNDKQVQQDEPWKVSEG